MWYGNKMKHHIEIENAYQKFVNEELASRNLPLVWGGSFWESLTFSFYLQTNRPKRKKSNNYKSPNLLPNLVRTFDLSFVDDSVESDYINMLPTDPLNTLDLIIKNRVIKMISEVENVYLRLLEEGKKTALPCNGRYTKVYSRMRFYLSVSGKETNFTNKFLFPFEIENKKPGDIVFIESTPHVLIEYKDKVPNKMQAKFLNGDLIENIDVLW